MAIRTDLVQIEGIYQMLFIDIQEIENNVFSFDNKIKTITNSNGHSIPRLQDCIRHFRNAKNMVRGFLKPRDNKYIDDNFINKMDEDIGRIDENVNKLERDLLEKLDTLHFTHRSEVRNVKMGILRNFLIEAMEFLVIKPLVIASNRWSGYPEITHTDIKEEGKEINNPPKDIYLFNLFLFQEVFHASQSVGGFTRQEIKSFPRNIRIYNPNPGTELISQTSNEQKKEEVSQPIKDDLFADLGEEIEDDLF